MEKLSIDLIKKLYYKEKLSTPKIAEKLGTFSSKVIKFMKKNNLERRGPRETSLLICKKKPTTFQPKKNLTKEEEKLKIAGIMLY